MLMVKYGATLAQWLESQREVPSAAAIVLFEKMFRVLAHVHGRRVLHLDIKSDNSTWQGRLSLLAFWVGA